MTIPLANLRLTRVGIVELFEFELIEITWLSTLHLKSAIVQIVSTTPFTWLLINNSSSLYKNHIFSGILKGSKYRYVFNEIKKWCAMLSWVVINDSDKSFTIKVELIQNSNNFELDCRHMFKNNSILYRNPYTYVHVRISSFYKYRYVRV